MSVLEDELLKTCNGAVHDKWQPLTFTLVEYPEGIFEILFF